MGDPYDKSIVIDTREPPETLYHYTDANGLLGILGSNSLWATDLAYMNDESEFKYGIESIASVIREQGFGPDDVGDWADETAAAMADKLAGLVLNIRNTMTYHVACLCEKGDLLSQWRGYGAVSAGAYAIGFDGRKLAEAALKAADHLFPVCYGLDTWEARVRSLVTETLRDRVARETIGHPVLQLLPSLLRMSAQIKHPSFEAEREWRIGLLSLTADYRSSATFGIVPYAPLQLVRDTEKLPIKEIVLGPGADYEMRQKALEGLLFKKRYIDAVHVKVRRSSIPYRPV